MNNMLQTTHRNILWFKKAHENKELELSPPYQRNPVWVDRQKAFLIDSILSGYPIPEIYMQDVVDAKGNAKYIVVDGQQRIRACLEYLEGKFAINAKDSPDYGDLEFDDLSDDQKKVIFEYKFVVRTLPQLTIEEIRKIFQRLNRNVLALNKQELRQATYWGPFIKCMNEISDYPIWKEIDVFTANDVRRMIDVEIISELAGAYLHGHQEKKKNLDKWYIMYEEEFDYEEDVKDTFQKVLSELTQIISNINKTRWSKRTDFYTLFLVFASKKEFLPLTKNAREQCSDRLLKFAKQVNLYVSTTEKSKPKFNKNIIQYAERLRASTDLKSRIERFDAISKLLEDVWYL